MATIQEQIYKQGKIERIRYFITLEKKIIISVGGLVKRKGFDKIISIMPSILNKVPEAFLVIVGGASVEGNYKPELEYLIDKLSLKKHVLFAVNVPHGDVSKWVNASDVFCLATSNEGWAKVFLEAFACGKPVVTTSVGGNGEVIKNDDFGMLVDAEDLNSMERALLEALAKKWNSEKLVEYAYQNSWDNAANEIWKNFREIKSA